MSEPHGPTQIVGLGLGPLPSLLLVSHLGNETGGLTNSSEGFREPLKEKKALFLFWRLGLFSKPSRSLFPWHVWNCTFFRFLFFVLCFFFLIYNMCLGSKRVKALRCIYRTMFLFGDKIQLLFIYLQNCSTFYQLLKLDSSRISLVVQWLRLRAPSAGDPGSIPGQGTRSHMPQLKKIPRAATKIPHSQINKYFKKKS